MQPLYERQVEAIMNGVGVAPPGKLTVMVGDKVRVKATISYRGTALNDYFYAAIGVRGALYFDEILNAQVAISFPQCPDWTSFQLTVDIPITSAIAPKSNYDLYVKIVGHTEAGLPEVDDCIDVVGTPEFQNFAITDYSKV
jgi:hypothetical protein